MTSPIHLDLPPALLGLPARFAAFRRQQAEAIDYAVYECSRTFTALGLATGAGKSLIACAVAKSLHVRAVYLTATKALQDQVRADFAESGMADIRGQANYECPGHGNCRDGKDAGCGYAYCPLDIATDQARHAGLVVTNYAWWMCARQNQPDPLGDIGLVIADEAPEAPELVSSFVGPRFEWQDLDGRRRAQDGESGLMPDRDWLDWAGEQEAGTQRKLDRLSRGRGSADRRAVEELRLLAGRLRSVRGFGSGWVWQADRYGVKFSPVWPGAYAKVLWEDIPRVLLLSATLRPYTLKLLGLAPERYDFREWPAVFLPQHGPVYFHPSGVKLNHRSTGEDYAAVVRLMDEWISARPGRRVLIQAGSYERAKRIRDMSVHNARFILNDGAGDSGRAADELRNSIDGILCSPSFVAGWDFPGRACELILIPKVPYPNTADRVTAERCREDGEYRFYSAVQDIVQGAGRARRYPADRCEVVIFDNSIKWLMGNPQQPWGGHAPRWFRLNTVTAIPPAPPRPGPRTEDR